MGHSMNNLARRIAAFSRLPIPAGIAGRDRKLVAAVLANSARLASPFKGPYKAPWLLVPYEAETWITTNRGHHELVDGEWHGTIDIHWRQLLPDGKLLTDPVYQELLQVIRQVSFIARSGLLSTEPLSPAAWRASAFFVIRLTNWLVLHEKRYLPAKFQFALLDEVGINSLLHQLALGGWFEALQAPQRVLAAWHRAAYGTPCSPELLSDPYNVPPAVAQRITEWLREYGYFNQLPGGAYRGRFVIKRAAIAKQVNCPTAILISHGKPGAFFRQFEPDFRDTRLLVSVKQETEFPSHKCLTRNEVTGTAQSGQIVWQAADDLGRLLAAHRHLPDSTPDPASISLRKAMSTALSVAAPPLHTPFMPVATGLKLLREAIRWVHVYGNAIVDGILKTVACAERIHTQGVRPARFTQLIQGEFKSILAQLEVSHDGKRRLLSEVLGTRLPAGVRSDFDTLRDQPTLTELLDLLLAACVICIGLLKPSRESELTFLRRDCLRIAVDGYYMFFELGKSNTGEAHQIKGKPVPLITAKAIGLMQRLGNGLVKIYGDKRKVAQYLFYIPQLGFRRPGSIEGRVLNSALDLFCDYISLPVDGHGRRWYVRIHEMRKWFLLLFFWSGRYDVLDALRWIAGHVDAAHSWAYLETLVPGEEIAGWEAEYAVDRLWLLERGQRIPGEDHGLQQLYDKVCSHFGVSSLSLIPESQWASYVLVLRQSRRFQIEPHSVRAKGSDEPTGITISFVLKEAPDARQKY